MPTTMPAFCEREASSKKTKKGRGPRKDAASGSGSGSGSNSIATTTTITTTSASAPRHSDLVTYTWLGQAVVFNHQMLAAVSSPRSLTDAGTYDTAADVSAATACTAADVSADVPASPDPCSAVTYAIYKPRNVVSASSLSSESQVNRRGENFPTLTDVMLAANVEPLPGHIGRLDAEVRNRRPRSVTAGLDP